MHLFINSQFESHFRYLGFSAFPAILNMLTICKFWNDTKSNMNLFLEGRMATGHEFGQSLRLQTYVLYWNVAGFQLEKLRRFSKFLLVLKSKLGCSPAQRFSFHALRQYISKTAFFSNETVLFFINGIVLFQLMTQLNLPYACVKRKRRLFVIRNYLS